METPVAVQDDEEQLRLLINEVQLVLAEKRTSLAVIRTGIAVSALPLSITGLLIATSKFYDVSTMLHYLIPLLVVCLVMLTLGVYLMIRGFRDVHRKDLVITRLKSEHPRLAEWIP